MKGEKLKKNFRIFPRILIALLLILSLGFVSPRIPIASAHSGDVLSAFGTATVDGVISPGEYGSCIGPVTQSGLTFMICETNDNVNDYYAIQISDLTGPNQDDLAVIFFDNAHDGSIIPGANSYPPCVNGVEDMLGLNGTAAAPNLVDQNYCSNSGWQFDTLPPSVGGTNNAIEAITFTPGAGYVYEVSHPLDSGDLNDYALTTGSTVGWCFIYFAGPDYSSPQVQYPAGCLGSGAVPSTATGFGDVVKLSAAPSLFDFSISASPSDVTVLAGGAASYTVTLGLVSGTSTSVSLSVTSGLPYGATASFTPSSVTPAGTATLQVSTSQAEAGGGLGDFTLTIEGDGGGVTHTTTVNLHVYDFEVLVSPSDATVLMGGSTTYTVTLFLATGSSTPPSISLGVSGLPADTTSSFGLSSITPTLSGASTTLSVVTAAPSGALGDFRFMVTGTDNVNPSRGLRSGSAYLHIYDFTIIPAPSNLNIEKSSTGSYSVSVAPAFGSSTWELPSIELTVTGLPKGTTASFSPSSGTPPFTSTLTITTKSTPLGIYTLTVTGTDSRSPEGGSRTGTATLSVVKKIPLQSIMVTLVSPGNGATVPVGSVVTLTARVTSNGVPILGATVTFAVDHKAICTSTTSDAGTAACSFVATKPGTTYSWYVTASKSGYTTAKSDTWTFHT
jgi:hypothetical protein